MPEMVVRTEGTGGAFGDVLMKYGGFLEMPHHVPIRIETLDHGMVGGGPSVAIILELPKDKLVVLAQTSVKLLQMAAAATYARYGDMTEGASMGQVVGGTFELTLSQVAECQGCGRKIPGSCRYCPECGEKL